MRLAHRVGVGFGLLVALMIAVLAYHTALVKQLIGTQQELADNALATATLTVSLERQTAKVLNLTYKVAAFEEMGEPLPEEPLLPDYLTALASEREALWQTLRELEALSVSESERQAIIQLVHLWRAHLASLRSWSKAVPAAFDAPTLNGPADPESPVAIGFPPASLPTDEASEADEADEADLADQPPIMTLTRLAEQADALRQATDDAVADRLAASTEAGEQVGHINSAVLLASLGMSLAVGYGTVRSIHAPLGRLIDATRAVASGRFVYQLDAHRDDELGRLAAAFNTMTRRLEALDRMKRDFVARVSHDLRTPLVAMQETNDVLLSELVGPLTERQRRLVGLNRRGAKRLGARIGHLLDLSRLEAGVLELDAQEHDLDQLVRDSLDGLEGRLSHRDIRLRTSRPTSPVLAYCDGERLTEVLENVLDNAIKFSPSGATIDVSLVPTRRMPRHLPPRWHATLRPGPAGGLALVTIADEGPGLAEADKVRVFRSFFRAGDEEQTRGPGAGLGLAICHDLVRAHRGAIWVTDNPGGGSRFHILLPTLDTASVEASAAPTRPVPRPASLRTGAQEVAS